MKNESDKYLPANVFEGLTSIRAIIKSITEGRTNRKIIKILYDEAKTDKYEKELLWLKRMAVKLNFSLLSVPSDTISELTLGTKHGGFVAVCDEKILPVLSCDIIKPAGFYVLLDGIEDPYNFGSAVRSCYAAGADGIILPPRNWMSSAGIVCRSSAGASELADIYVSAPEDAVKIFKSIGYKIVCSGLRDSVPMYDVSLSYPIFLIIGGEMRGISRSVMNLSDVTIKIEYGRDFPAALSAQSSAAILAFEVYRQNHIKGR